TFTGDADKWQGNFVLHVYNTKGVTLKDLGLTGGDAGLLVNGSEVTLEGTIDVSGNQFGGIEVSKGIAVGLKSSVLTVNGKLVNNTEESGEPTIWLVYNTDPAKTPQGNIEWLDEPAEYIYKTKDNGDYQRQYYIDSLPINLENVLPSSSLVLLEENDNFILVVDVTGTDIRELEVDHSMQGTLPEFSVYADPSNPYGSQDLNSAFESEGVTVTYDDNNQEWTINFGEKVTDTIINKGGITFYLVIKDQDGNQFGTMYGTTEDNTFSYEVLRVE
ncbi:MAG: hypothetical protein GX053_04720, partial [Tissierella sp.]|nr:hypothetical protein [Tissierella sp.]